MVNPSFYRNTWTHTGLILDSYWTHCLFGTTEMLLRSVEREKKLNYSKDVSTTSIS